MQFSAVVNHSNDFGVVRSTDVRKCQTIYLATAYLNRVWVLFRNRSPDLSPARNKKKKNGIDRNIVTPQRG